VDFLFLAQIKQVRSPEAAQTNPFTPAPFLPRLPVFTPLLLRSMEITLI
jgi:hypothetical protein